MPISRPPAPALRVALITIAAFAAGAAVAATISDGQHSSTVVATATPTTTTSLVPLETPAAPSSAATTAAPTTSPPPTTTPSTSAPTSATVAGDVPAVDAQAYVVYDASTGIELAADNADAPLAIGSVQKLLTAYVMMQAGDPDKVVTVPPMELDQHESQIGLYAGEQLSRAVLLRAVLIVSANDAARALAQEVAGSEDAFVAQMNAAASALGLHDTVAANPTGLDAEGQHSTAHDVLTLTRTLMADDTFRATVARRTASLHGMVFASPNELLGTYLGADGIKTGHTTNAGYCLAASATRDGRSVYVVVLGASSAKGRTAAAVSLLDWAFTHLV